MKRKQLPQNLLSETWTDLDSDELRLLLRERFGPGLGQYTADDGRLYLPLAGAQSRIALTYDGNEIVAVEPAEAFDAAEWEQVSQEIERSILTGTPKTGRDYSFSSFPVQGSWRGRGPGFKSYRHPMARHGRVPMIRSSLSFQSRAATSGSSPTIAVSGSTGS